MTTEPLQGGIADLSYKGYSGPLEPPKRRWWVIARSMTAQTLRKRAFWILTLVSSWYYLVMVAILFFIDQTVKSGAPASGPGSAQEFLQQLVWKDQLLNGFTAGQLMWMSITLMIGAGAIANDRRTNALLIYLSRPCTKGEYLKGKWMGIFLPLVIAMGIPTLAFLLYGSMNLREMGFFGDGAGFVVRALVMIPLAAAFHTSLVIGISSLFDNGRVAGSVYAGIYFLTSFFTKLMWVITSIDDAPITVRRLAESATYFAIDGQILAIAKNVMGSNGSMMFGLQGDVAIPARPPFMLTAIIFVAVVWISLQIAWSKIRAVEVAQ